MLNDWVDSYRDNIEKIEKFYEETLHGLQRRFENSKAGLLYSRRAHDSDEESGDEDVMAAQRQH